MPNKSTKKVVLIVSQLGAGGAERAAVSLASSLSDLNWQVSIVSLIERGRSECFYSVPDKIDFIPLGLGTFHPFIVARFLQYQYLSRKLKTALLKIKPDICIAFSDWINAFCCFFRQSIPGPLVLSEQIPLSAAPVPMAWKRLHAAFSGRADAIVGVSQECIAEACTRHPLPCTVIPGPFAININLQPIDAKFLERPKKIVCVGRLAHQKGYDILLDALNYIKPVLPGWNVDIYGEGDLRSALRRKIQKFSLEEIVTLKGLSSSYDEIYGDAQLFVLASRVEGFPHVLYEAMLHRLPIIATKCSSAILSIICDKENGFIVPNNDPWRLGVTIGNLIENADLRKNLHESQSSIKVFNELANSHIHWDELLRQILSREITS